MRNRPWVEKFESGEYLRKWNGFEPHITKQLFVVDKFGQLQETRRH